MSSNDKGKSGISNKNKLKEVKSAKQSDKLPDVEKQHPEKTETGKFKSTPIIFYIILIVIPVLFFVLLESSLRLFHYGIDTRQWVQVTQNKLMLNSDIAHRYFYSINNVPYSNQDVFDKVKAKNSFRVFVLGESSGAGYPYMPVGAFSDFLKKRLEILYPESKIEVVNLSMTAINSYALRDMMPGVLEQRPDLILIYTGHNEYYGALGVGSMESLGSNPFLVNSILYINKFKTVELLRNFFAYITKIFSSHSANQSDGTLMSRIAKDQYIVYGSAEYKAGINQFQSNLKDILKMAKEEGVPVILGTLTSNLSDQPPFKSIKIAGQPEAAEIFRSAKALAAKGDFINAGRLFRKAKDLDCIRFRAPEDLNLVIRTLGKQYAYPVVEIDSAFNSLSPQGIVGSNLMTDHLHPSLSGYQLMAKLFFNSMKKFNFLPVKTSMKFRDGELDTLTISQYRISKLDSAIAEYRIIALKNDWPFVEPARKKNIALLARPKNYIDSLAFMVCFNDFPWEAAHRKAADWYLSRKDFKDFQLQIDILIDRFPVIVGYYQFIANQFLGLKRYSEAYDYLQKYYQIKPDAFSAKWLGIIDLSRQNIDQAIYYLQSSLQYFPQDAQVLFNLSGAYINKNDYPKALEIIGRCLAVEPDFPGAVNLKAQLSSAVAQNR